MTRARAGALLLLVASAMVMALVAAGLGRTRSAAVERPRLLLLTGLPLMFGEDFSLKGNGSEALRRLRARYDVVPISTSAAAELAKGRLLLMAQPFAQSPENLVALDQWVRDGGRVLLLADPMLEWPSSRPLGDPLRPPPSFVDTGLLAHWGLRLDAPDERGIAERRLSGATISTASPGKLFGTCSIEQSKFVAECRLRKGRAIVVADADFLNGENLGPTGGRNLDSLLATLKRLVSHRFAKSQTYPQGSPLEQEKND